MKKTILLAVAVAVSSMTFTANAAGKGDKTAKQTEKTAKSIKKGLPVNLTSSSDTLSYAVGMSITNGLREYLSSTFGVDSTNFNQFMEGLLTYMKSINDEKKSAQMTGIAIGSQIRTQMLPSIQKEFTDTPDSIVEAALYRGFADALNGDTTIFDMNEAESVFETKRKSNAAAKEEKMYGENRRKGQEFLAENARKDGVTTTPSGLQYKVLVKGYGATPKRTDKVKVHYEGKLVDGTVFDASRRHGTEPISFRADQVIKGWTEALTMMPVGSKWQLFIPQELAYGSRAAGQIPPYSTLIFTVELIGIE